MNKHYPADAGRLRVYEFEVPRQVAIYGRQKTLQHQLSGFCLSNR
nr:MAG TPA_asm: hypothetical protein [Caudoviricetes sp.]